MLPIQLTFSTRKLALLGIGLLLFNLALSASVLLPPPTPATNTAAISAGRTTAGEIVAANEAIAAGRACGVPNLSPEALAAIELETAQRLAAQPAAIDAATVMVIPVAFHVFRASNGIEGHLSQATIESQIDVINNAYAPYGISFVLEIITYTNNDTWFNMDYDQPSIEEAAKTYIQSLGPANGFSTSTHLNIYTIKEPGNILGWATFPWDLASFPILDGVVIDFRTLPGGAFTYFNEGDTLTHEAGHWLGLFHPFEPNGLCGLNNDYVDDTPNVRNPSFSPSGARGTCDFGKSSCGSLDDVSNFMDYADDACMDHFTAGQRDRMFQQAAAHRSAGNYFVSLGLSTYLPTVIR